MRAGQNMGKGGVNGGVKLKISKHGAGGKKQRYNEVKVTCAICGQVGLGAAMRLVCALLGHASLSLREWKALGPHSLILGWGEQKSLVGGGGGQTSQMCRRRDLTLCHADFPSCVPRKGA